MKQYFNSKMTNNTKRREEQKTYIKMYWCEYTNRGSASESVQLFFLLSNQFVFSSRLIVGKHVAPSRGGIQGEKLNGLSNGSYKRPSSGNSNETFKDLTNKVISQVKTKKQKQKLYWIANNFEKKKLCSSANWGFNLSVVSSWNMWIGSSRVRFEHSCTLEGIYTKEMGESQSFTWSFYTLSILFFTLLHSFPPQAQAAPPAGKSST